MPELANRRTTPIDSPCIGVCTLDGRGRCAGCGRSLGEIADWMRMSDQQRAAVMETIAKRLRGTGD